MITRRAFLPLLCAPAIVKFASLMPVSSAKLTTADVISVDGSTFTWGHQLEAGAQVTSPIITRVHYFAEYLSDEVLRQLTAPGDLVKTYADPVFTSEIGVFEGMRFIDRR